MKKILAVLSVMAVIVLCVGGGVFMNQGMNFTWNDSKESELIKNEQDRMVKYLLERYSSIKKIEFQTFEENKKTGFYSSIAVINDKYRVTFYIKGISGTISLDYYTQDFEREFKNDSIIQNNHDKVEIIYVKDTN